MSSSDKLFISRVYLGVITVVSLLITYAVYDTYSNEIQDEITKVLVDSFGHLEGELAKL